MERIDAIGQNKLFIEIGDEERSELAGIGQDVVVYPGDVVYQANDAGDSLYLITEGAVTVVIKDESGEETEVATLPSGSYFGEMEVLEAGMTRTATIMAKEKSALLKFDAADLNSLLERNDKFAKHFYRAVCKELVRRLRSTTMTMGYYKVRSLVV